MNLYLTASLSRTQKSTNKKKSYKPRKSNTEHKKIKLRKFINEYCTKQNQSTYIHKPK